MADANITSIDLRRLEYELARQADLVNEWGRALGEAESDLDDLKTEQELVEAEVAYAIRRDPERYMATKSKLSETMINKIVPMQPEYQDAAKAVNQAKRKVAYLKATVKALDHKKSSLESLVKQQLAGFFAEVKIPRERRDVMQHREDEKLRVGIDRKGKK